MPVNESLIEEVASIMQKDPSNYEHFFRSLASPEWIEPLIRYGFFQVPGWPESQYLKRMASIDPDSVLAAMLQVKTSDNAHVQLDLVEAACAMPASQAAHWAKREAERISNQAYLSMLLPDRLGKLVAHLATGSETQAAIAVAASLLSIGLNLAGEDEDSDDWPYASIRPRPKFQEYEYKYVLETSVPPLLNAARTEALSMLCNLLDKALEESTPVRQRQQEDFSKLYKGKLIPSNSYSVDRTQPREDLLDYQVELIDDDSGHSGDPEDKLIASIRDAATSLIKSEQVSVENTVEILEEYSWRVFCRISLHVLRLFPDSASNLIAERLTDDSKFGPRFLPREYDLLLKEFFPTAPAQTKQDILAFIDQSVTVENIRVQISESDRTPSELQRQVNRWKLDRLSAIQCFLPAKWQQLYGELRTTEGLEHYQPPEPEYVSRPEVTTPGSPKSQDELAQMPIQDLVAFLGTWDSPSWKESPNTLGRYLSNLAAENPQRFAESARAFRGLDATYVHAVIGGLREAVKNERAFDWEPVLELCRWAVSQPYEIPGRDPTKFEDHKDPHWGWSYKAVADLLQEGLEREDCEIPFEFRSDVWQIIAILAENPEPTREDEAKSHSSPEDGSISTVRGVAMHCVIVYALWVRRSLEQQHEFDWTSFGHVPEAREVLERHLDPCHDPSLAVRAVYGQYVPALDYLDRAWTSKNLPNIFPHNEIDKEFWCAAWESYIRFAGPNTTLFHRLEDEYRHALTQLNALSEKEGAESWMFQRFTGELMLFHWHGELDLQHPDGLLSLFYEKAPSTLRAKAHESVGRWLQNNKGSIETAVIQRLEVLWASRLHAARSGGGELSYENELAAFGWWFASGRFDDKWAINQLIETLETGGSLDDKKHVVKHLATLAPYIPIPVARALHLLVEATDYLRVFMFDDEAKEALQSLLASGCEEAEEQAKRTIDHLLTLGHRDFRDLQRSSEK